MPSNDIKTRDKEYVMGTYGRNDLCIVKGKGAKCYSPEGKEFIDFSSGIGVNSLGFCNDEWISAVTHQLNTLQHTSNLFYTEPCVELAEILIKRTNFKKMFFANSGAEANEGAIKTMRKYSNVKYGGESRQSNRTEIIALNNSFHGRTMSTITATGQDVYHKDFHPFSPGFIHSTANDFADLKSKISDKTCGIMIELVQGEGGVITLDREYVQSAYKLCKEKDILLMVDEVQTGIGRTGKLFAYEHYKIEPDIVTVAKGLGGGLPIGGILFGERACAILEPGDHGTTFGGNPVVCAGGVAILNKMTPEFLKEVAEKGKFIEKELKSMPKVKSVSGLGMMLGVEVIGKSAKEIVEISMQEGLILLTAKEKVRLLPPLNISYEEIEQGLNILKKQLSK